MKQQHAHAAPEQQLSKMLSESGATLIRSKRHNVYQLPNGKTFTVAKTPSDHRAMQNQVSELKRLLGLQKKEAPHMDEVMVGEIPEIVVPAETEPVVVVEPPPPPKALTLRDRISVQIKREEETQTFHMEEAEKAARRADLLKRLVDFADDPNMEQTLMGLMGHQPVTEQVTPRRRRARASGEPKPPKPDAPPQSITNRVQVTQQLVYAALQTLPHDRFTLNDVVSRMINEAKVSNEETKRIRASIYSTLVALTEKGQIRKKVVGTRSQPGVWSLA